MPTVSGRTDTAWNWTETGKKNSLSSNRKGKDAHSLRRHRGRLLPPKTETQKYSNVLQRTPTPVGSRPGARDFQSNVIRDTRRGVTREC